MEFDFVTRWFRHKSRCTAIALAGWLGFGAVCPALLMAQTQTAVEQPPTEIEVDLLGVGTFAVSKFIWSFSRAPATVEDGRLVFKSVEIHKPMDEVSTDLMLFCARGEPALAGKISVRQEGDRPLEYLVVNLRQVTCASYTTTSISPGKLAPVEKFFLNFGELEAHYSPHAVVGGLKVDCPELSQCLPMQVP